MGRILIDPAADFSASPVGHVGLTTSVSSGLQALHELRYSKLKACHNSAPGKLGGTAIGAPTYSTTSINATKDNSIQFGTYPANGGLTFAFVVKLKNGGAVNDGVVGSFEGNTSTQGYIAAAHYNRRVQVQASTYAAGSTPPLSGVTELLAYLDFTAPDDGTFQLFIATAEDNVALTIYHPKTGNSLAPSAVGRIFVYDGPGTMRTCELAGTTAHDIALFAHWSRVITSGERATFYAEMKEQMARYGVTI